MNIVKTESKFKEKGNRILASSPLMSCRQKQQPRYRVGLPTPDDPIRKIPHMPTQMLEFQITPDNQD